jgi:hypothetical protein
VKPYPSIYKALLYSAECHSILIVPLSVDHGIKTMISLEDLVTDWWLKGSQYGGRRGNNLTDLSTHHMTIIHFPMSPELKLDSPYTIFRPEFPISSNILVKMNEEDKNLIDLIVTEYIEEAGHNVKWAECN